MTGGAADICYSVDGVPQPDYTAPFVVAGDGSHLVSYYAVDAAGNIGDTTRATSTSTPTPPVTTATDLVAGPDTGWVHDAQQVTLTAHDDGCGDTTTWYTLDGSDPIEYDGAFPVAGVQSHEITYWSVDCLGNREDTQTGYVNIAPDQALITLVSGLAGTDHTGWRNTPATVTLTPSGGGGTIVTQYSVERRTVADLHGAVQRERRRLASGRLPLERRRERPPAVEHRLRQHRHDPAGDHGHRADDPAAHRRDRPAHGGRRAVRRERDLL